MNWTSVKPALGVMLLTLVATGVVGASPSALNLIPTGDVMDYGSFNIQLEADGEPTPFSSGNGKYLLSQFAIMEGLEVGVDLYEFGTSAQTVLANAKWQFMQETDSTPAIAVGLQDLTRNGLLSSWYVSASKDVGALRLHLGYMDNADDDGRGMLGLERYFGDRTCVMLDYTTGPEMYHTAGAYYDLGDGLWGGLYYARNNTRGVGNFVGLNLYYGGTWRD